MGSHVKTQKMTCATCGDMWRTCDHMWFQMGIYMKFTQKSSKNTCFGCLFCMGEFGTTLQGVNDHTIGLRWTKHWTSTCFVSLNTNSLVKLCGFLQSDARLLRKISRVHTTPAYVLPFGVVHVPIIIQSPSLPHLQKPHTEIQTAGYTNHTADNPRKTSPMTQRKWMNALHSNLLVDD